MKLLTKRLVCICYVISYLSVVSHAQNICENYALHTPQLIKTRITSNQRTNQKAIHIVVHIFHSTTSEKLSAAYVYAQLEILNQDFNTIPKATHFQDPYFVVARNPEIQFCLASKTADGTIINPIQYHTIPNLDIACRSFQGKPALMSSSLGGVDPIDPEHLLNIYVIDRENCPIGEAIFPWDANQQADGIIIDTDYFGNLGNVYGYNGGKTCSHEIGHYLGLLHLFGPDSCMYSDQVDDTPFQAAAIFSCDTEIQSCGQSIMQYNLMQVSPDPCLRYFTKDQVKRMYAMVEMFRPNLFTNPCSMPSFANVFDQVLVYNILGNKWLIKYPEDQLFSFNYRLLDMQGKIIETGNANARQSLRLPSVELILPHGMYYLQLYTEDQIHSLPLINY